MIEYLKRKWKIESYLQLTLILIAFAIAGSSSVFVGKIFSCSVGIDQIENAYLKQFLKITSVFFLYQILLLTAGTLLGQHTFFYTFLSNMWKRILNIR